MKQVISTILLILLFVSLYGQEQLSEPYLPARFIYTKIEGASTAKIAHYPSVEFRKVYHPDFDANFVKIELEVDYLGRVPATSEVHYSNNLVDFVVINGVGPATDSAKCFYENKRLRSMGIPSKIEVWKPYSRPIYDETYIYSIKNDSLSIFAKSIWNQDSSYSYVLFDGQTKVVKYEINFQRVYNRKYLLVNEDTLHRVIEGYSVYNSNVDTVYYSETYNFINENEVSYVRQAGYLTERGKLIYNANGLLVEVSLESFMEQYDRKKTTHWTAHIFYEYDSHNNWIKRVKIDDYGRGEITLRTIEY